DRHHLTELHQRLDDLGGLDRHLVREIGDRDRLGNRDVANEWLRLHCASGNLGTLLVAMTAALRAAPCGRRGAGGNITEELRRAPSRRFFLEHLSPRFLDRLLALLAGLRGGTMERSF